MTRKCGQCYVQASLVNKSDVYCKCRVLVNEDNRDRFQQTAPKSMKPIAENAKN